MSWGRIKDQVKKSWGLLVCQELQITTGLFCCAKATAA